MPRTYRPNLSLPPAPRPKLQIVEGQRIPKQAQLLSVKSASQYLSARLDGGYSTKRIYTLVKRGEWTEGIHYARDGSGKRARLLIYVDAVIEWVINPAPAE